MNQHSEDSHSTDNEQNNSQIVTFGCRLNHAESQIIADNLKILKRDDVIVVHTCSVTKNAEKESLQKTKELIKQQTQLGKKIFVTGCSAQLNPDQYLSIGADRVIGNMDKLDPNSYEKDQTIQKIWRPMHGHEYRNNHESISQEDNTKNIHIPKNQSIYNKELLIPQIAKIEGKTRGLIQIQNGCNHDCTFCVIYIARGKNRSVPPGEIIKQIEILLNNGYQEIVLTGVDITDYGKDLTKLEINLGKLVRKIIAAFNQRLKRLRLSSIDVAEIDEDLFEIIATNKIIMPYIHLSMQSGSDLILKRMKRRHLSKDIKDFCTNILSNRPEIVFGADIIAGFPTETDALFQETVDLITQIPHFIHLHVFAFSAHSGTPAARMPQVNEKIIKERAGILRKIGNQNKLEFYQKLIGTEQKVLFEKKDFGYTEQFLKFKITNQIQIQNNNYCRQIKSVIVKNINHNLKNIAQPFSLEGDVIS